MTHQMPSGVEIRRMQSDDYPDVRSLWEETEGVSVSVGDDEETISNLLEAHPMLSLVAEQNGRLIGSVIGGHDVRRGYIHHFSVRADWQRRGVGRELLDTLKCQFQALGIKKLHCFVFRKNRNALEYWESKGFHQAKAVQLMSFQFNR